MTMKPPTLSIRDDPWLMTAAGSLREGGIVALPTETFYALGTDPRRDEAVARLLRLKGYALPRAVLLLAADLSQVERVAELPAAAVGLAARFWPGPLTLVLPCRARLPACPGGTVAVRIPAAEPPRALAAQFGHPLTGTSANAGGADPADTAEGVARALGDGVDLILDGGTTAGGAPSTLLDLAGGPPRLLREGRISRSEIEACMGVRAG